MHKQHEKHALIKQDLSYYEMGAPIFLQGSSELFLKFLLALDNSIRSMKISEDVVKVC